MFTSEGHVFLYSALRTSHSYLTVQNIKECEVMDFLLKISIGSAKLRRFLKGSPIRIDIVHTLTFIHALFPMQMLPAVAETTDRTANIPPLNANGT